jgi:hypothetical protein
MDDLKTMELLFIGKLEKGAVTKSSKMKSINERWFDQNVILYHFVSFCVILCHLHHCESFWVQTQWLRMTQNESIESNQSHQEEFAHLVSFCVILSQFDFSQTRPDSNSLKLSQNDSQ